MEQEWSGKIGFSTQASVAIHPWLLEWQVTPLKSRAKTDWWNGGWHYRLEVKPPFSYFPRQNVMVYVRLDLDMLHQKLGLGSRIDPHSVRVVEAGGKEVASRWMTDCYAAPDDGPGTILAWVMRGRIAAKRQRRYDIYFDTVANGPKEVPEYTASALPQENWLRNANFSSFRSDGLPARWRISSGSMKPADYLSVSAPQDDGSKLRLEINAQNRAQVTEDAFTISQRIKIPNPEGQTWMAAASFFLEHGSCGCPVELRVRQFDGEGREVGLETGRSTHRKFTAAMGQQATAVVPVPLNVRTAALDVSLSFWPALYREVPGQGRHIVHTRKGELRLTVSDLVVRPDHEVFLAYTLPASYIPGAMDDAPINTALLLEKDDTFIFNTFPTMKSWGIGKPVHFDIRRGTLEMWVRPNWDVDDGRAHMFFRTMKAWYARMPGQGKPGEKHPYFELVKLDDPSGNRLQFLVRDHKRRVHKIRARVRFARHRWTHVAATWDFANARMALFADGKKVGSLEEEGAWPVESVAELLEVGNAHSDSEPGDAATRSRWSIDAAIDELRVSDRIRYRTSFEPPRKEFELDRHTRALFHFETEGDGIHDGGDRFVPGMTTLKEPCRERFLRMDRLEKNGQISAFKIQVVPMDDEKAKDLRSAHAPWWQHDREKLVVHHPDPAAIQTVLRSHEEIVKTTSATFNITVGGDYPPAMRMLRIETLGPTSSVWGAHVTSDGAEDLSSADRLFQAAFRPGMGEREKALALFGFVTARLPWWTEASEQTNISGNDPIKALNCYGGMICSSQSRVLADLYVATGLSARTLGIGHHVVCEVFYEGDWHLMDMTYGLFPLKRDYRTVASWDDFGRDQFLGEQVTDGSVAWNVGDNRSWSYHYLYFRSDSTGVLRREMISLDAHLKPLTIYDRYWYNWGKRNEVKGSTRFNYWAYGNGELCWRPDLSDVCNQALSALNVKSVRTDTGWQLVPESGPAEVVYEVCAPYVIVDAEISGSAGAKPPLVHVSVDGGNRWVACKTNSDASGCFQAVVGSVVNAVYAYCLRFRWSSGQGALENVRVRTIFQTNTPALPALEQGENRVSFSARKLKGQLKLRYEWVERYASPLSVDLNALGWYPVRGRDPVRVYFSRPGEPFDVRLSARTGGRPMNASIETNGDALTAGERSIRLLTNRVEEQMEVVPRKDLPCGLYPFGVRVETREKARTIDAVALVSSGAFVLKAEDFKTLQGGMICLEDAEIYGKALTVVASKMETGCALSDIEVNAEGAYYVWAYLGGAGRRAGAFRLTVDGKKHYKLCRQGYEGLQIRELGLSWYWARAGKTVFKKGGHTLNLSGSADGSRFGALVFVRAQTGSGAKDFETLLENVFLNRNFRLTDETGF